MFLPSFLYMRICQSNTLRFAIWNWPFGVLHDRNAPGEYTPVLTSRTAPAKPTRSYHRRLVPDPLAVDQYVSGHTTPLSCGCDG